MLNKKSKVALLLIGVFSANLLLPATAVADKKAAAWADTVQQTSVQDGNYYDYLGEHTNYDCATENVPVSIADFSASDTDVRMGEHNGKNALIWEKGNGNVAFRVSVPKTALYNLNLTYMPLKNTSFTEYRILIDGKMPFADCDNLIFTSDWVNATEKPRCDSAGNEVSPEQILSENYVSRLAMDNTGVVTEPYLFALQAGEHTVTLCGNGYGVAISNLSFDTPENILSYKEVSKNIKIEKNDSVEPIIIEGERASLKSDKSLIPKSTNGDSAMTPIHPYLTKINYIGGSSWNTPGQTLTWEFDVIKEGYYNFGARYKQNELIGGESWRKLKIDGKTPFAEANELRFPYGTKWDEFIFGGEEPYSFYLEKGKHTLSLEVTLGDLSTFYDRLNKVVTEIGDMYLQIVMITGETPDANRDYELFNQIPDFTDVLTGASEELKSISEDMKKLLGNNGNQYTAAVNNMKRVIDRMLDGKYISHIYVSDYYTNYTTLSSWLGEMKQMPLAIDQIRLCYAGSDFGWKHSGITQRFLFSVKRLISSFTKDYNAKTDSEDSIKLWVNWGRDQTMALDSLIRDSFTAETGIKVELQIVSNSIINGLLAGNFPDLQLYLPRTAPVNYGMRGALLDLTEFSDYGEVLKRFKKGADTPYWYNGALYALPDSQSFFCMFYRKDVFEKLGLTVPTTWDEFLYCSTIIQQRNMGVYVPYTQISSTTTVDSGIGSLNLFPTLMLQRGQSLYNKEQNATDLLTKNSLNAFSQWTKMYTDYGYLKEADFYNRFRNGSMPLGIAPYTTYLTIYSAAPEIKGRWAVANVPGTAGGTNIVAGGGTGCSILKQSKHQKQAWEFLKWWTSADTQVRYCENVESVIGVLGRINTSNVEAFSRLSWDPSDLTKLSAQWDKVEELPEVPGSYYLTRAVDQAFWEVVNDDINVRDALTQWSKVADDEIQKKIAEYS